MIKVIIGLLTALLTILTVQAQGEGAGSIKVNGPGYFGPLLITVLTDPYSRIPIGDVPIDRYFYLRLYYNTKDEIPNEVWLDADNNNIADVQLAFIPLKKDSESDDINLKLFYGIDIFIPPLEPNAIIQFVFLKHYNIRYKQMFQNYYQSGRQAGEDEHRKILQEKKAAGDTYRLPFSDFDTFYQTKVKPLYDKYSGDFVEAEVELEKLMKDEGYIIVDNRRKQLFYAGSLSDPLHTHKYKIETSAPLKLVADAGVVVAGFHQDFLLPTHYIGLSYSFRSYDTDIPFRLLKNRIKNPLKYFSIHAGLTLHSFTKEPYRKNLFGNNNIMLGAGYRLSHVVNLIGGLVFYNRTDANPLLDVKTVGARPYAGISINLKIRSALGDIAKLFSL